MTKKERKEFDEIFRLMGVCLFGSQRLEFVFQVIVLIFGEIVPDKRFKGMTIKSFLEDTPSGKKIRKTTLGILSDYVKGLEIIDEKRLSNLVRKRNFIVHNIWREELKENKENRDLKKCIAICNDFIEEVDIIENAFKGFIFQIYKKLKEEDRTLHLDIMEQWEIFEKVLLGLNEKHSSSGATMPKVK